MPHRTRLTLEQKLKLIAMVEESDLSAAFVLDAVGVAPASFYRWVRNYREHGVAGLIARQPGPKRKVDDPTIRDAVFELLHSPPQTHGVNRTTWKLSDMSRVLLTERDIKASETVISKIIREAGYKYRKAKKVLTSNDPEYREKLDRIQAILSDLGEGERFFSIDEFGPFSVKAQPGRRLVKGAECPTVPQWQKSKGCLILTAALELSSNQITHFYSSGKNTTEMIRLLEVLLAEYRDCRKLYLSWDAASWHASKRFMKRVDEVNTPGFRSKSDTPEVELAPLPSGAQFLNVIESVFSGLARAVIHNSDYASVEECQAAIDRYFHDRNSHFQENPKRAGKKIWGKEKTPSTFSESQNCKDARWR